MFRERFAVVCGLVLLTGFAALEARAECVADPFELVVAPEVTDPAIDQELEDHYVYRNPDLPARDELVVWFSGSCGQPRRQRMLLREAARAGYRAIGLNYANCPSVNGLCDARQPADPDCYENVRLERLDGIDRTPLVAVSAANSIVNRLTKLLRYLDTTDPGQGWGGFVDGVEPRWESLVVAGHSQGGGMAAIIGKQHVVARVAMFSWKDTVTPIEPAPWLFAPKATPAERYYGFSHQHSAPVPEEIAWNALGLPGSTVNVDTSPEPYDGANRLTTDVLPETGSYADAHGSVVTDPETPLRSDATPLLAEVWRYLLGATPPSVVTVQTTKLSLRDGSASANPEKRKVSFRSKTTLEPSANRVVPPAPGSPGDPTVFGAVLEVFNAETGLETARVALAAEKWESLGSTANPRGWHFLDRDEGAPIQKVIVAADKLTVSGSQDGWCFTLDETRQGLIGMRLVLGDGVEWCALAPAKPTGDPPSTERNDTVDLFNAEPKTPPPAVCPLAPRLPLVGLPGGTSSSADRPPAAKNGPRLSPG